MRITKRLYIEIILILVILLSSFFLLTYKLDSIPAGLYVDEALVGYNAYSILTTGKDEYGKSFPIAIRFFGAYTPPLYVYLTSIAVKVFDLNIFSTRVVSVISGILTTLIVYLYLRQSTLIQVKKYTPFLGAILFMITPWNVFFSRAGYEVNLGLFLFSLSVLLFWLGIKNSKFLPLGFLSISLGTYAAHVELFLAPLFVVSVTLLFYKDFFSKFVRRDYLFGFGLFLLTQIPHFYLFTTKALFVKNDLFYLDAIINQASKVSQYLTFPLAFILAFLREFASKFFAYFSPKSLFYLPDPDPQRSIPELSVFYPWMVVLYLAGLYLLIKSFKKKESRFLIVALVVAVIPASLSGDPFSTQRVLPLLFPLIIVISLGLDNIIGRFRLMIWLPVLSLAIFVSLIFLWRSYFVLLYKERAEVWGYGFSELAREVKLRPQERFVFDQSRIKPIYIELAFFLKYPPADLQKVVDSSVKENYYTNTSFDPGYKFSNIEIRNINWEEDIYEDQILVGDSLAISEKQALEHKLKKVFQIDNPLGFTVFQGYKTSPIEKCRSTNFENKRCSLQGS